MRTFLQTIANTGFCALVTIILATATTAMVVHAEDSLPVAGMVTMIDLGAGQCIPCKMMAPILKEVEQEYKGKAVIHFIDVWKSPKKAEQYGIRLIPTQIFYDAEGREAFRHEGFMDKDAISAQLTKLGVR